MQSEPSNPFAVAARPQAGAMIEAVSQRESQEVQAMVVMAKRFPRDQVMAMDRILQACTRPTLAEGAVYSYSKGGSDVSGPSIRLAEAIAQQWGNLQFGFREVSRGIDERGAGYSEVEAYSWDIETNTRKPIHFRVRHWRDKKNGGGYPITDEREIYELVANMASRRVRNCIQAVIPGDVFEQAVRQCETTLNTSCDTSPEAIKKMLAAFEAFGVKKLHIEKMIQRRVDAITPAAMVRLKKIYASLRDGMSTPEEWFEMDASAAGDELGEAIAKGASKKAAASEDQKSPAQPKATEAPLFDDAEAAAIAEREMAEAAPPRTTSRPAAKTNSSLE